MDPGVGITQAVDAQISPQGRILRRGYTAGVGVQDGTVGGLVDAAVMPGPQRILTTREIEGVETPEGIAALFYPGDAELPEGCGLVTTPPALGDAATAYGDTVEGLQHPAALEHRYHAGAGVHP